jgi:hypothetical protein
MVRVGERVIQRVEAEVVMVRAVPARRGPVAVAVGVLQDLDPVDPVH